MISLEYDDYFTNAKNITAKNIEIIGDSLYFETDDESLKYLNDNNICYMFHNSSKEKRKKFLINKSGFFIAIIFVLILIYMNTFRVSRIVFNEEYPINDEIRAYLKNGEKSFLFFSFHADNYDRLAKSLRKTFYEYEWINIKKEGTTIYVNISNEKKTTKKEELEDGYIVAKKAGIIKSFCVYNGYFELKENTYVKAGDILIKDYPKGYVLATTYDEVTINVNKVKEKKEFTGKSSNYYNVKFFTFCFDLFKKNKFDSFDSKNNDVFSIPYILDINKIEEFEKNDIIEVYNKNEAISYAKSIIEDRFYKERIISSEKIIRLECLEALEKDSYFEIRFLVKKLESIGVWQKEI